MVGAAVGEELIITAPQERGYCRRNQAEGEELVTAAPHYSGR
jgi:hypothetical protein